MSQDQELSKLRQEIDAIDGKLLGLLNQRGKAAQKIGRIKAKNNTDVFSSGREQEILSRLVDKNSGPLPHESVEDIFQAIFSSCRSLQKRHTVAYLGPEATFTHQMAIKHFGRNADFIAVPSIADVFSEVERNRADYGVVPIENSTEGVVNHTLDMFMESELVIAAEQEEPISQNLFSISGNIKNIKSVYSHPQALAQCRKWLDIHLPGVAIHEAASTADAAVHATLDASCAAIASRLAGEMYHLKPVALDIADTPDNATRFLVIGRQSSPKTGKDKTSILFSVKDHVGALYEPLSPFRKAKINLTKIESRPTKKRAWEYLFFVDFVGHQDDNKVQLALKALKKNCSTLKVLGSYPFGG